MNTFLDLWKRVMPNGAPVGFGELHQRRFPIRAADRTIAEWAWMHGWRSGASPVSAEHVASSTTNAVALRARKFRDERGNWGTHAEALCAEVERLSTGDRLRDLEQSLAEVIDMLPANIEPEDMERFQAAMFLLGHPIERKATKRCRRYVYCEILEGGMEAHELADNLGNLRTLRGWMSPECEREDEILLEWAQGAKPGTYSHHRLGVLFCVTQAPAMHCVGHQRCDVCDTVMGVSEADRDCGGTCLTCMARAGDPDCIATLKRIESERAQASYAKANGDPS